MDINSAIPQGQRFGLVFGKPQVRISTWAPTSLSFVHGFPKSLRVNAGIEPEIRPRPLSLQFIIHCRRYIA
jgi:hypothetical protein